MAGAHGLRHCVEGVHDDEEVDGEGDEAGDERPRHVAAVGPHLRADGQPPGVLVAVLPHVRYRSGGCHRAGEKHPDDLHHAFRFSSWRYTGRNSNNEDCKIR